MARWTARRRLLAIAGGALAVVLVAVLVVVFTRGTPGQGPAAGGPGGGSTSGTMPTATSTAPGSSPGSSPPGSAPTGTRPDSSTTAKPPTSPRPPSTTVVPPFPDRLRGQDVTVLPTDRRVVALTFDAGANSAGLAAILRTLAQQGVPATFFVTGDWAVANPAGLSSLRAAGYRVGNHSMTHPNFTGLSDAAINDQVLSAQRAILAGGVDPRPLFRFPSGDRDARTIADVNRLGYVAVRWTVDTLGWKGTSGGITARQVTDRALGSVRPGEIVLMHIGSNPADGSTLDADALPGIIAGIRAAGYGFVTLDSLLGG